MVERGRGRIKKQHGQVRSLPVLGVILEHNFYFVKGFTHNDMVKRMPPMAGWIVREAGGSLY
jgi:hypothetical protein